MPDKKKVLIYFLLLSLFYQIFLFIIFFVFLFNIFCFFLSFFSLFKSDESIKSNVSQINLKAEDLNEASKSKSLIYDP